jgi:DNA-binding Lrp family transcriptional regulator
MDIDAFLDTTRTLLRTGVVRRFSASINHRRAGFVANAMCCWAVPPDRVDMIGNRLAALKEVSHCYERKTNGLWRHNLFAMVHGRSREVCEGIADAISQETGLFERELLYSTREFKKSRIRYSA